MLIQVPTPSKKYEVEVRSGLLKEAGKKIEVVAPASSYLIVADENVASLYLKTLIHSFSKEVHFFLVPSGEQSKSIEMFEKLSAHCLEQGLDRSAVIVALGGGVIGDLAGFVAGTYMRGIRFVQVPTSLLAHDSSVGGKVAVNLNKGKNMIGVFHQPEAVFFDTGLLKTLPQKEWRSGFAEIVKLGLISDASFYYWLQEHILHLEAVEENILTEMIGRAVQIKANIVSEDEREQGIRAYLNLGHTLAHAIEAEMGYGGITHGEAVAIGIRFALKVSSKFLGSTIADEGFTEWFNALGIHFIYQKN
ncbi:3-dehydroquinate synthase [Bacillus sp. JCM 19041]|uniref:3-dehydroquinate synthase n=1 Tax=Bacillus sp. JCM 19041 TaxID=1460637 RepID=UPI000A4F2BB6